MINLFKHFSQTFFLLNPIAVGETPWCLLVFLYLLSEPFVEGENETRVKR